MLVGAQLGKLLYVYCDDDLVQSLTIPFNDAAYDAVWSPREQHHIVCTTDNTRKAVVLSVSGDVVHQTQMVYPMYLSVSADNDIYVACQSDGVYYSTDNGATWNRLVSKRGLWQFEFALEVAPDNLLSNYSVWIIESNNRSKKTPVWRLSIYTPRRTWTDVVLPNTQVNVENSRMTFDGHTNIYMTDWNNTAVHVWSVNGQYVRQLLSSQDLKFRPENVALNKQLTKLYVAVALGINVFVLQ